jgi:hypothetical protein
MLPCRRQDAIPSECFQLIFFQSAYSMFIDGQDMYVAPRYAILSFVHDSAISPG